MQIKLFIIISDSRISAINHLFLQTMNCKKLPGHQPFIALPGYYLSQSNDCTEGTELNNCESPTYGLPNASLVLNAGGRRSIQGQLGKKLYTIPALPPTCATINALKGLQQNRAKLMECAGKFTVPGIASDTAQKKIKKVMNVGSEGKRVAHENASVRATVDSQLCAETDESKEMDLNENVKAEPDPDNGSSLQSRMQKLTRKGRRVFREQIVKTQRLSHEILRRAHASHDYQMLLSRFLSLFTWPTLLSSIQVTDPLSLLMTSMTFAQICSEEDDEFLQYDFECEGFENDSDSNWKPVYK